MFCALSVAAWVALEAFFPLLRSPWFSQPFQAELMPFVGGMGNRHLLGSDHHLFTLPNLTRIYNDYNGKQGFHHW